MVRTVETTADGTTVVTESVKVTRKTYTQDWPAYNAAQTAEKETVQRLLRGLCDGIQNPAHPGRGRKPIAPADAAYAMTMKVYTTVSGRRATTDIKACAAAGQITRAPSYNSVFDYFDKPEMTPILTKLIEDSAAPLAGIETSFAIDSTGFGTTTYRRWFSAKYGKEMAESIWIKAHAMIGTVTGVVTSVNVTDSGGGDCPELPAQQARVRAALRFLRVRVGGWRALAIALGFSPHTVTHVRRAKRRSAGAWRSGWRGSRQSPSTTS
jgi:hypothetical protein